MKAFRQDKRNCLIYTGVLIKYSTVHDRSTFSSRNDVQKGNKNLIKGFNLFY